MSDASRRGRSVIRRTLARCGNSRVFWAIMLLWNAATFICNITSDTVILTGVSAIGLTVSVVGLISSFRWYRQDRPRRPRDTGGDHTDN